MKAFFYLHIVPYIGDVKLRLHDICHTFMPLYLQGYVDPETLSEALGHATMAFTLDVYGHCNEDMKRQAADKLEKLIC